MILSAQSIRKRGIVSPFCERTVAHGMTYGLGPSGYDIRAAEELWLDRGGIVRLASSIERFDMPNDLLGQVCDKSSWARKGLFVQNTIIEPGWRGYLTLELTYEGEGPDYCHIPAGAPIAQVVFMRLDEPTEIPYSGKYQDQEAGPQEAR